MARRGRKRRLDVESEYWRLALSGVGTVEAGMQVGVAAGDEPGDLCQGCRAAEYGGQA